MDPVAALKAFDDALACGDREAIAEHAGALIGWISKDGFMPVGPHGCDWRGKLTPGQFASYLRECRHIAEMI